VHAVIMLPLKHGNAKMMKNFHVFKITHKSLIWNSTIQTWILGLLPLLSVTALFV